jgi:hypothetical protein
MVAREKSGVDSGRRDSRSTRCCGIGLVVQVHWPWPRRGGGGAATQRCGGGDGSGRAFMAAAVVGRQGEALTGLLESAAGVGVLRQRAAGRAVGQARSVGGGRHLARRRGRRCTKEE